MVDPAGRELTLVELVRSDIEAATHPNYRLYSNGTFWRRAIGKALTQPNMRAVITYRIAHALSHRGLTPLAMLLRARALRRSGAEIHPLATIGPGFHLVHSSGVVIGTFAVIGRNCHVHQSVTIGPPREGQPGEEFTHVGDDVTVGAGAVILGGVTVGDGAFIGANAVVTKDVGKYEIVAGVPAVVIGHRSPDDSRTLRDEH
jgi:serine O-acetyltransferase